MTCRPLNLSARSASFFACGFALVVALAGCSRNGQEPARVAEPDTAVAPAATAPALPRSPAPAGARVFFISPTDGATVSSPVKVEFGIEGMDIVPAGVEKPDSGHHHLLVDTGLPDLSQPIPADAKHIHFGDGSTSTELQLDAGQHTLCLLLGDHRHVAHDPPVKSAGITITVQ